MNHALFFPNLGFAWLYLGVLFTLLVIASGTDWRQYLIPKWIALAVLVLGVVGNAARGAWLASQSEPVWKLGDNGALVGAMDGLLFAGCGFLVGFGLFFLMWVLNVCGGGDVKLFAALGACVGGYYAILILAVSLPVVLLCTMGQIAIALVMGNINGLRVNASGHASDAGPNQKRRKLGFSLPVTIATALVMLWVLREELNLVPAP